ncbi:NADH-ubiquinone oxidoreductase 20.9 kDa subunit [Lachnellula cervina]|uniref:NADH-ubiquinone oxidoreductase 20.9 kDa subunit n=1 Tax=Lachnellula cervina TaxID=1316786 RepID=A0A7D8YYJ9_9HELO|nr:NADH-ubiquinone oxidoreductase 20.9 kDa subunit [Lachnellula cervina]
MSNTEQKPYVPAKTLPTDYPLIDSDPHFKRVLKYARTSDYVAGAVTAAFGPGAMLLMEKLQPSLVGKGGFASIMRLSGAMGLSAGFLFFYQRSILRFYGFTENRRELEMDMREMVTKVKAGEPLYGTSTLTPYMQGMASRNSRYTGIFLHVIPWFNFVNHNQHGVDTAKYYQAAERELEEERKKNVG